MEDYKVATIGDDGSEGDNIVDVEECYKWHGGRGLEEDKGWEEFNIDETMDGIKGSVLLECVTWGWHVEIGRNIGENSKDIELRGDVCMGD